MGEGNVPNGLLRNALHQIEHLKRVPTIKDIDVSLHANGRIVSAYESDGNFRRQINSALAVLVKNLEKNDLLPGIGRGIQAYLKQDAVIDAIDGRIRAIRKQDGEVITYLECGKLRQLNQNIIRGFLAREKEREREKLAPAKDVEQIKAKPTPVNHEIRTLHRLMPEKAGKKGGASAPAKEAIQSNLRKAETIEKFVRGILSIDPSSLESPPSVTSLWKAAKVEWEDYAEFVEPDEKAMRKVKLEVKQILSAMPKSSLWGNLRLGQSPGWLKTLIFEAQISSIKKTAEEMEEFPTISAIEGKLGLGAKTLKSYLANNSLLDKISDFLVGLVSAMNGAKFLKFWKLNLPDGWFLGPCILRFTRMQLDVIPKMEKIAGDLTIAQELNRIYGSEVSHDTVAVHRKLLEERDPTAAAIIHVEKLLAAARMQDGRIMQSVGITKMPRDIELAKYLAFARFLAATAKTKGISGVEELASAVGTSTGTLRNLRIDYPVLWAMVEVELEANKGKPANLAEALGGQGKDNSSISPIVHSSSLHHPVFDLTQNSALKGSRKAISEKFNGKASIGLGSVYIDGSCPPNEDVLIHFINQIRRGGTIIIDISSQNVVVEENQLRLLSNCGFQPIKEGRGDTLFLILKKAEAGAVKEFSLPIRKIGINKNETDIGKGILRQNLPEPAGNGNQGATAAKTAAKLPIR